MSAKPTIDNDSEQAVKQRLQTLVTCGDDLVKHLQNKHGDSCEHRLFPWSQRHRSRPLGNETKGKSHHYQQVSMSPCKHGDVHGNMERVGFIQTHSKVSLPAQQQQNEHADVH